MARSFNGTSDTITTSLDLTSARIVSWVFRLWWNAFANDDKLLMQFAGNGAGGFQINPDSAGTSAFATMMDGGSGKYQTFPRPSAAAWHHYVIIHDRATPDNIVYVDGIKQTMTSVSANAPQARGASGTLALFSNGAGGNFGAGRFADFAAYENYIIGPGEAMDLARGISPLRVRPDAIKIYIPFEGVANDVTRARYGLRKELLTRTGTSPIASQFGALADPTFLPLPDILRTKIFGTGLLNLPSTITGSWSAHKNQMHGPFEISGNLYVFTIDGAANKARAYKSTNNGQTWAEQDSANAPAISATAANKSVSCTLAGSTLYVAYIDAGNVIRVRPFSADAWGAASSATSAPAPAGNITNQAAFGLHVRSNGDYVVYFQSATETVGTPRRRFSHQIYSAGAWGSVTQYGTGVAADFDFRASILGASDRTHVFFTRGDVATSMRHQSLSSTNVLDTENGWQSLSVDNYDCGMPTAFVNGGNTEIAVPFTQSSPNNLLWVNRFNSGANPTHTQTTVQSSGTFPEVTSTNCGACAAFGTTKYAFYVQGGDKDIYRDNDGGSNSWGSTDTPTEANITGAGINANGIFAGIGLLYMDSATVRYDSIILGPFFSAPSAAGQVGFGAFHGYSEFEREAIVPA